MRLRVLALGALLVAWSTGAPADDLPFGPGERVTMRVTYAHLLAGRAWMSVERGEHEGRPVFRFVSEAQSQGFFAWLFRFRVDDRSVALWDPEARLSYGIEKRLREGRARRDQVVRIDNETGVAHVEDSKIEQTRFELPRGTLDVLSAFFVARLRGIPAKGPLKLPVFDNGKRFELAVKSLRRETLDLPDPLGRTQTIVVEPELAEGTGLFVKKGRLILWLTDDQRRIPVRMRTKVAIGSVSADIEAYVPPQPAGAVTATTPSSP